MYKNNNQVHRQIKQYLLLIDFIKQNRIIETVKNTCKLHIIHFFKLIIFRTITKSVSVSISKICCFMVAYLKSPLRGLTSESSLLFVGLWFNKFPKTLIPRGMLFNKSPKTLIPRRANSFKKGFCDNFTSGSTNFSISS